MKNEDTKKKAKKPRKQKRRGLRILRNIILIIVIAFAALFALANLVFYMKYHETIFSCARYAKAVVNESTADTFRPNQTSYVYSSDGTEIAKLYEDTDSTYLEFDEIPKDVINAFVAVEDRTFWDNSGIDMKGIVRVCLNYLKTRGDVAQGASTITQQLSRDIFLTNEKSLERKVKEIFIARDLTKKYSKEDLMEFYCNNVCFANGIYGIEDASQQYFRKPASELTLSEAAYLCAIPNRPEYYNPFKDSSTALTRRDKILDDMYECGYISQEELNEALNETMDVASEKTNEKFYNYETSFAIDCAVEYLMGELYDFDFQYHFDTDEEYKAYHENYTEVYQTARHMLYTGGYTIETTIDLDAQENLQKILDDHLAFSTATKDDDGIYNLQGAMTVIDNNTGKVIAAIGGRSQDELSQTLSLNRSYQTYRQPGSSIKPLVVYTPALMKGYTSSSTLKNVSVKAANAGAKVSSLSGSSVPLREAVIRSLNGCAYWAFNDITPNYGMSFLDEMEFSNLAPEDYDHLTSALGGISYGTNTTEMANGYYTLYNHGTYTKTDCIASIKDKDGNEIYSAPESKDVYSASAADEMVDILKGVLSDSRGTAHSLRWSSLTGTEAAGKTGTTNDNREGWFCGMTPYYTISVYVGNDDHSPVGGLSGASYPAQIWKDAMYYLVKDKPDASFDLSVSTSSGTHYDTDEEDEPDENVQEPDDTTQQTPDDNSDSTVQDPSDTGEPPADEPEPDDIQGNIDDTPSADEPDTDTGSEPGDSDPAEPDDGGGSDPSDPGTSGGDTGGTQTPSGGSDSNSAAGQNQ
ncbi:MAG TPA: transglycosylase domain-containing protein [Candidatus Eubacterium avistercoris]|uniref:Penicillin-binding protein 1A n=1 Tax=Candidatus Eubacterium avistercoris TaxID=2838567 RepID=A0A9D2IF40_9FIRM|nr:transglycosylase domain-containing protein [Candidatus Eubacterium avistercoris]